MNEVLVYVVKCYREVKKGRADQDLLGFSQMKIIGDFGERHLRGGGQGKEDSVCKFRTEWR